MDAIIIIIAKWRKECKSFARTGDKHLTALIESYEQDLIDAVREIADTPVPYDQVEDLTGYAKGSPMNRPDTPNIGTKGQPAFRPGVLPFEAGSASNGKMLLALCTILRMQRDGGAR